MSCFKKSKIIHKDSQSIENVSAQNSFMNVVQAANYLNVKPSTIYAWVHRRQIPFRKHGRKLVFSKMSLEKWSQKREFGEIFTYKGEK